MNKREYLRTGNEKEFGFMLNTTLRLMIGYGKNTICIQPPAGAILRLEKQGYFVALCKGWEAAAKVITEYLTMGGEEG